MEKRVVKVNGLQIREVYAVGGDAQPELLPKATNEIRIINRARFITFSKNYACGHRAMRSFKISVYGVTVLPAEANHNCPECCIVELQKTTIRCALCGLPIFPGSGVAIYDTMMPDLDLSIATYVSDTMVIGCMDRNCCPYSGAFAGNWTRNGFKQYAY